MITPIRIMTIEQIIERSYDLLMSVDDIKKLANNERNKAIDECIRIIEETVWRDTDMLVENIREFTKAGGKSTKCKYWNTEYEDCTLNYKEIENKVIDEFAEKLKDSLIHNYRHLLTTDSDGFDWITTDAVGTHIDEIAEQLKGGV